MPLIKNHLTTNFLADKKNNLISTLIEYTTRNYRPYDPGQYLYKLVIDFSNGTKFSDEFIELAYTTLIAWNMNQRGAKLSEFKTFKKSLLEHKKQIESLRQYRIEKLTNTNGLTEKIKYLFDNLQLVYTGKPKLVTFSKTLHYFLPNLLMPIDRSYTIKFFYGNTYIPKGDNQQFKMYSDIFQQFRQLATTYNFDNYIDDNWNRNIPKIIDNIIIAHIQTTMKKLTAPKTTHKAKRADNAV